MLFAASFFLLTLCAGLVSFDAKELYELNKIDTSKYPNAKCLDGSPAGYWYMPGSGSGLDKFAIHHQGGGWCTDLNDCVVRSSSALGSSTYWPLSCDCDSLDDNQSCTPCTYDGHDGLMSKDLRVNPLMHNWNKIFIGYCDGASYSGHVDAPIIVESSGGNATIHFKGRYIIDALYDTFLSERGMDSAADVVISGTSAGGLSVYLHADYLANKIRSSSSTVPRITAVPDAGYFLDYPSIAGDYLYTPIYKSVFNFQNVSDSVNQDCIDYYSKQSTESSGMPNDAWKCFMAPYTLPFVKTPTFIINSLSDSWQGSNIMGLTCTPGGASSQGNCDEDDLAYLSRFRAAFIDSMSAFLSSSSSPSNGAWLCDCWRHSVADFNHYWDEINVPSVDPNNNSKRLGQAFMDWYTSSSSHSQDGSTATSTSSSTTSQNMFVDGEWLSNPC